MMNTHNVNRERRNPAEYIVLGMLARGPAHGYEMVSRLRADLGDVWRLGQSQVYALLGRLERDGLVKHRRVGQDARPDRKRFSLTPQGRKVYGRWAAAPVTRVRDLRLEFLGKLYLALLEGEGRHVDLIREQKAVLVEKQKAMDGAGGERAGVAEHAVQYRRAMLRAALGWLRGMEKEYGP